MNLHAAFARRTDARNCESRIVRHRERDSLAPARMAFDAHVLRVHRFIRLEIIQHAARAPGPRAQRAPIVHLARLTFVYQADDPLGQARAIIRLDTVGRKHRITPALRQNLLLPWRPWRRTRRWSAR